MFEMLAHQSQGKDVSRNKRFLETKIDGKPAELNGRIAGLCWGIYSGLICPNLISVV